MFKLRNEGIVTLRGNNSGLWSHVDDLGRKPGDLVVGQCYLSDFFSDADPDSFGGPASFCNGIASEFDVFGLTSHFDSGTVFATAVFDNVVFDNIAIGPEVDASVFIPKQNPEFAAVTNLVIPHDVVGIIVPDGNAIQRITIDRVVFRESVFDTPAPEDALTISLQTVTANNRPLGT